MGGRRGMEVQGWSEVGSRMTEDGCRRTEGGPPTLLTSRTRGDVRECERERKARWAVEGGWRCKGGRRSVVGCRRTEGGRRRVLVKRRGYNFELFKKVSLAKIGIMSDIH